MTSSPPDLKSLATARTEQTLSTHSMNRPLIDYAAAVALILKQTPTLAAESCATHAAHGRLLAANVYSPEHLPPFDNSAMDGFALAQQVGDYPAGACFNVQGICAAGDAIDHREAVPIEAGGCWQIMTGAVLPAGCDRVVAIEQVEVVSRDAHGQVQAIRLMTALEDGRNVRGQGEDIRQGELLIAAGTLIGATELALLAAVGVAQVSVRRRPRVALICTGSELLDDALQPLTPGKIRNSNAPLLAARLAAAGAELVVNCTVSDDAAAFRSQLAGAQERGADMCISCGAVSMGEFDFVPKTLRDIGATIHFHKAHIRPGKPILFASLPDGCLHFGLPGNPAASAVGERFFVEPALRAMQGLAVEKPLRVPLVAEHRRRPPWQFFLKGRVDVTTSGQLQAHILQGQQSFRIRSLAEANCWIVMPAEAGSAHAGDAVAVYALGHLQAINVMSGDPI